MNTKKENLVKIEQLINWYFGNFCVKCGRIDIESEKYGKGCVEKMQRIKSFLNIQKMTHKEFRDIIKNSLFCKPIKRKFNRCNICEAFGMTQKGF